MLAFCDLGIETFERARSVLEPAFGKGEYQAFLDDLKSDKERIEVMADNKSVLSEVTAKAERTSEKIRTMRDTYVGDRWDELPEVLEWLGFFEGAAIVHFSLIEGIEETEDIGAAGASTHKRIFEKVNKTIKTVST